jgi:hypothetical protein
VCARTCERWRSDEEPVEITIARKCGDRGAILPRSVDRLALAQRLATPLKRM